MLMWVMSDRAIPRSFSMMEGFGVHSYRLVNAKGQSHFVKFHWKPILGVHSLVWDEAVKIAGQDPDFHRRDMFDSIEKGNFFEWELGVQILPEEDEMKFDFDILDATKIIPEDLIPVQRVGKMVLNRNPDNYFAETEQVAFMTSNVVQGIDFSNDPLLQGRNFSYNDTQLSRLGSPNFHEIPINRPVCPFSNNQRDAHMRTTINKGRVSYAPSSLDGHTIEEVGPKPGFVSYPQKLAAKKSGSAAQVSRITTGKPLFFGTARPRWRSTILLRPSVRIEQGRDAQSAPADARASGENQRCAGRASRRGNRGKDRRRATQVEIEGLERNVRYPCELELLEDATTPTTASGGLLKTKGLSMEEDQPKLAKGRKVAILVAAGVATDRSRPCRARSSRKRTERNRWPAYRRDRGNGGATEATKTFANCSSVLFDAVYVPGGKESIESLQEIPDALRFIDEAYKHGKAIAASSEGVELVKETKTGELVADGDAAAQGVLLVNKVADLAPDFIAAIANHRFHNRQVDKIMA